MHLRRTFLFAAALLLGAGSTATRWVMFHNQELPADEGLVRAATSPSQSPPSGPVTGRGRTAASSVPSDGWMLPYQSMTLDQAFETVARQIRFEPYAGIQRGARGTALAQVGNAIDQALLLAAILRAGGYDVRFVHGSLPPQNVAALLRGLYPPKVPPGVLGAEYLPYDPPADAQLATSVRDHYWVEVNQGATWLPLDPSFPRAKIGEAYGTAADRFREPPSNLYQHVALVWSIATASRRVQEVARWSGTVADFGLQPMSLVVDGIPGSPKPTPPAQPSAGGMFGGALTGAAPPKAAAEPPAAGQAPTAIRYVRSVETDTIRPATGNVSMAGQPGSFVQREWIDIRLTGPGGLNRTVDRTLYEIEGETPAPHAEHRRYTILVVPGPVHRSYVDGEIGRSRGILKLDQWRGDLARLQSQAGSDTAARAALQEATSIETATGRTAGYLMTLDFAATSDVFTERMASASLIAVGRPLPRILIAASEVRSDQPGQTVSSVSLDLRLDEVEAYPYPGFTPRASGLFLAGRGMQESVLEGQLIARWTGRQSASTAALMAEAGRNHIQLLEVDSEDRAELGQARGISPRARREIEAAVNAGRDVIVPVQPITIAGQPRWGWWEIDPASGAVVGVMEGGQHQATVEYAVGSQRIGLNDSNAFFLGAIAGSNTTMLFICAKLLETGTVTPELIAAVEAYVKNAACNTMCPAKAEAAASVKVVAGDDCFKVEKIKAMKAAIGGKVSLKFCAKYNEGFKCASGLILAGLKGETPGIKLVADVKTTLPCGVGK